MTQLRTREMEEAYAEAIAGGILAGACPLCRKKSIKEFAYWRVVENDYPYDRIAKRHDMLIPKRHVREEGLSEEEWKDLFRVKTEYVHPNYNFILQATYTQQTIPDHFHLHLLVIRDY